MGDRESEPPPAKRPKLEEEAMESELPLPKLYEELDAIQDRLANNSEQLEAKILALHAKLQEVNAPLFKQRAKLIKLIPRFWSKALLGHPVLCDIFRPLDKKLFAKLLELHVEESFDPKDQWYSIAFVFDENEWFHGSILWKKFVTKDGAVTVTSSGVKLKPEHSKLFKQQETFLNWFLPEDQDTELGKLIKDDIWANPVLMGALPEDPEDSVSEQRSQKDEDTNDGNGGPGPELDIDQQLALAAAWASDEE